MSRKPQQTVLFIYSALIAAIIFGLAPLMVFQTLSVVLFLGCLITAYVLRAKDLHDGLLSSHMTYLIRTIWIFSLFLGMGMISASIWVYIKGDFTDIDAALKTYQESGRFNLSTKQDFFNQYLGKNKPLLMTSILICLAPAFIYLFYRLFHGLRRAVQSYRIAKPTAWF